MDLFQRLFRQPPTAKVLPAENMTTEVLAYLLEAHRPFRSRFLQQLGFDQIDGWSVNTQVRLAGLDSDTAIWNGKIPDIVLQNLHIRAEVLCEVKIDAGATFSLNADGALIPQTEAYAAYLSKKRALHLIDHYKLVTLTRWTPPQLLAASTSIQLRLSQIAQWLDESAGDDDAIPESAWIGTEFSRFLYSQRWAMRPLNQKHLDAIQTFVELQTILRDVLFAVNDAALTDQQKWRPKPHGRLSTSLAQPESYLAAPPIIHATGGTDWFQATFWFGTKDGHLYLLPGIYIGDISRDYSRHAFQNAQHEPKPEWNGHRLQMSDISSRVSDGGAGQKFWSHLVSSYLNLLDEIDAFLRPSNK